MWSILVILSWFYGCLLLIVIALLLLLSKAYEIDSKSINIRYSKTDKYLLKSINERKENLNV